MKKHTLLLSALLLSVTGCSNGEHDQTTNLRVINAVPDVASVDFSLDFKSFFDGVGYLESSGYTDIDDGQHILQATVTDGFTPLAESTTTFSDSIDYTLLVFGLSTNPSSLLLRDDNDPAGSEAAKIRLINVAQASRNVDVYVLKPNIDLLTAAPTEETLTYRQRTSYVASSSGQYVVTITPKNSKDILAQSPVTDFRGEGVYTILITDAPGGTTPPGIVILTDR